MARLVINSHSFQQRVLELKMGVNKIGRTDTNDFQIEHATISSHHAEIILKENGLTLRDCNSTNGTFVEGKRVTEATLQQGQTVALGDVQLLVESTEVVIAIPQFEVERPAPPVVLTDGSLLCPHHPKALAIWQCKLCRQVMCDACVHRLRRRGGKMLKLCPLCSHEVERIGGTPKKRRSFLALLQHTVKLPFLGKKEK